MLFLSLKPGEQVRKLEELVITRYPSIRREVQTVWVEPSLSFATRLVKTLGIHYNTEPQLDGYLAEVRAEGTAVGEYLAFFWRRAGICVVSCETFRVISLYLRQMEPCVLLQYGNSVVWTTESEYCRPNCEESDCQSGPSGPSTSTIPLFLPVSRIIETVAGANALVEGLESKVKELFRWSLQALQGLQQATNRELEEMRGKLALLIEQTRQHVQAYKDQLSSHNSALHHTLQVVSQLSTLPSKALTATKDTEAQLLPQLRSTLSAKLQQWQAYTAMQTARFPVLYTNAAKSELAEMKVYVVNFKRVRYYPAWIYVEMDTRRTETVRVEEGIRPGLQAIRFSDATHFQGVSQLTLSLWTATGSEMHQLSARFEVSFDENAPISLPSLSQAYSDNAPEFLLRSQGSLPSFQTGSWRDYQIAQEISEKYGVQLEIAKSAVERVKRDSKELSADIVFNYMRENQ